MTIAACREMHVGDTSSVIGQQALMRRAQCFASNDRFDLAEDECRAIPVENILTDTGQQAVERKLQCFATVDRIKAYRPFATIDQLDYHCGSPVEGKQALMRRAQRFRDAGRLDLAAIDYSTVASSRDHLDLWLDALSDLVEIGYQALARRNVCDLLYAMTPSERQSAFSASGATEETVCSGGF
jgi:hypothetical protein